LTKNGRTYYIFVKKNEDEMTKLMSEHQNLEDKIKELKVEIQNTTTSKEGHSTC